MSSDSEIRAWARENGQDVSERGRIRADVRAEYEAAHPLDEQDGGDAPFVVTLPAGPEPPAEPLPSASAPSPAPTQRREEIAPKGKKQSAADRFRQRFPKQTPARRKRPRVSVEDVVSGGWALAGWGMTRVPQMVPVGRCLMMQSGVAGIVAEEHFKGTAVDKILQPIARAGEQGKVATAMIGPPLLVGMITAKPELMPVLRPFLHMALLTWVQISGPAIDKAEKKMADMIESTGGLDLDALIDSFWSLDGMPVQHSPDEDAAVRRASDGS